MIEHSSEAAAIEQADNLNLHTWGPKLVVVHVAVRLWLVVREQDAHLYATYSEGVGATPTQTYAGTHL